MPVFKTYSKELVEMVKEKLETAEKPVKTEMRKSDLLKELAPIIKKKKKDGFDYRDIVQVISESSDGAIRCFVPEIEEICGGRKRTEQKEQKRRKRKQTQPIEETAADNDELMEENNGEEN